MSNPSITADKTPWYQWDTGLTVTVSGGEMTECHFANRKQGTAYVQAVINGVARVPDELLQVAAPIKVYGFAYDDAGGKTYVEQTFDVIARNIPSDYTYTKTIQKTIRDAEAARDEAVKAAKDAKASELAADDSAVEASNSAQSAGESASAASTSASNAAKSAGDAAKSARDAKAAADNAVEDASAQLKTYTDNAAKSAGDAANSASNAADAASAASGSASAASTSASEAAMSAQEAKDAADNAASEVLAATKANADASAKSATDAATAKAGAENAESNAAASASSAAASAENAANSARTAANSVNSINVISPKTVNVSASSSGQFDIAIGQNAKSTANQSIAIGVSSEASHLSSIAIGGFATTSKDYEVAIGTLLENGADVTREITHVSTPTGPNSASTKKYTDDNDANTLVEAKKYTDANTSNALVGTVSGKLLHVEDAWPSKPLGLTIDGAYKQDGTPSPESPVSITVVENTVLWVTGKNIFDYKDAQYLPAGYIYDGDWIVPKNPHDLCFMNVPTIKNARGMISADIYSLEENPTGLGFSASPGKNKGYPTGKEYFVRTPLFSGEFVYSGDFMSTDEWASLSTIGQKIKNVQYEVGEANTKYTPYVGTTIPITLPAEHPYLAALPDGTHDEIVIDKDGNASLVAMVGKTETAATDGVNATVGTDALSSTGALADGATVYYKLSTQVTYHLGKLDIPALPETISNVWVEASLTPECAMTYKQDVNVVIAGITAQINALKGTNDIVHDDSTASPDDAIDVQDNSEAPDVTDTTIA